MERYGYKVSVIPIDLIDNRNYNLKEYDAYIALYFWEDIGVKNKGNGETIKNTLDIKNIKKIINIKDFTKLRISTAVGEHYEALRPDATGLQGYNDYIH